MILRKEGVLDKDWFAFSLMNSWAKISVWASCESNEGLLWNWSVCSCCEANVASLMWYIYLCILTNIELVTATLLQFWGGKDRIVKYKQIFVFFITHFFSQNCLYLTIRRFYVAEFSLRMVYISQFWLFLVILTLYIAINYLPSFYNCVYILQFWDFMS